MSPQKSPLQPSVAHQQRVVFADPPVFKAPYVYDTHLSLHHGGSLCSQGPHSLEDIHHPLVLHPLQHDAQRDEHAGPPDASAEKIYVCYFFVILFSGGFFPS